MPLSKFVLILISVIVAAGITVWVGALVASMFGVATAAWLCYIPIVLIALVLWRLIAERRQ